MHFLFGKITSKIYFFRRKNGKLFHFQMRTVTTKNTPLKIKIKPMNDGQVSKVVLFVVYKMPLPLFSLVIKWRVAQLFPK